MYIKSLKLKNYRCYENLEIELNPEYTILVGVNGAGKSTILDALATALGSYIAGFDGIDSNSISQDDVHLKMYELGVADIAYRMAVLNPQLLDHILDETPGIVLIDEVDMHLHPEWQKRTMDDLHYIFPKIQFVVTTHSPSVLANVKREHVLLLEEGQVYVPGNTTYGRDISAVMHEIMKVEVRPEKVQKNNQ